MQFLPKIQNGRHFLREKFFFENWHGYSAEIPCGSKIQNGRHFWRDKIFLKIGMATLQRYPAGQKFRRNRSI